MACYCGHSKEEHGHDPEHPGSMACIECDCIAYEEDKALKEPPKVTRASAMSNRDAPIMKKLKMIKMERKKERIRHKIYGEGVIIDSYDCGWPDAGSRGRTQWSIYTILFDSGEIIEIDSGDVEFI